MRPLVCWVAPFFSLCGSYPHPFHLQNSGFFFKCYAPYANKRKDFFYCSFLRLWFTWGQIEAFFQGLSFERLSIYKSSHNPNKARYTATPVACGWAGAIFEVSGAFWQERYSQKNPKRRKSKVWWTDGPTDGRTDGPTDRRTDGPTDQRTNGPTDRQTDGPTDRRTYGPTKRGVESRSTRLKIPLLRSQKRTHRCSGNADFILPINFCTSIAYLFPILDDYFSILEDSGPPKHVLEDYGTNISAMIW